ncbi:YbhB/YbcL family Raf kinase inhibitor-like protein [Dongia deserti]|uniref:YbhB/YbcL family Raf kinase inhibitor-like protein n=1 Tax=Dongia deserti TaxID=2268030 RepID=UPI000E65C353|nr:YbhB/YbcL family Raf kinase inhibitor-like protein [Dongia deserti]
MTFELRSPAFRDRQRIPVKYTVDGEDVSPALEWSDPPRNTRSFALIVEDPDAPTGTFRHWGVYNIMSERDRLPEGIGHGVKTEDLGMGINDFGEPRYRGPAPPKGHGTHHYHFKLLALDVESLMQAPKVSVADIWKAAQGHTLGQAELVGTYSR